MFWFWFCLSSVRPTVKSAWTDLTVQIDWTTRPRIHAAGQLFSITSRGALSQG